MIHAKNVLLIKLEHIIIIYVQIVLIDIMQNIQNILITKMNLIAMMNLIKELVIIILIFTIISNIIIYVMNLVKLVIIILIVNLAVIIIILKQKKIIL